MFHLRTAPLLLAIVFTLLPTGSATAQERSSDRPVVEPPRLVEAAPAPWPPAALAHRIEGVVVLRITLDAEGQVIDAEVEESLHPVLDDAALQAARASTFAPATRDGEPMASRIRLPWAFELPPGSIQGRLTFAGTDEMPAAGVEVGLLDEGGAALQTRTDAAGRFRFEGLRHGGYRILAGSAAIGHAEAQVTVEPGGTTEPTLALLHAEEALEVTVVGRTEAEKLRESARAVHVIETEKDKRRTADLGEVLARTHGVAVRRDGGLGSDARFALNGLEGDQIRFFLDGVPLHLAGYPFGLANVPVNLVDRVEVYRGVVPIQFGADALGGAVHLVSDDFAPGTHGSASWQVGSFGTHRLTAGASHLFEDVGFLVTAGGFFDSTDNDYDVRDVGVFDDVGRRTSTDVERFHDAYQAGGGNVLLGFVDRPFARRLLLRAFVTDFTKELQHDALMATPYGEVEFGGRTAGSTLRYEHEILDGLSLDLLGGFTWTEFWLLDESSCNYDWLGRCLPGTGRVAEMGSHPQDSIRIDRSAFARLNLSLRLAEGHTLRFSTSPTTFEREGDNRSVPDESDPLRRDLSTFSLVSGVEYEAELFDGRLENVLFVKDYRQSVSARGSRIGADVERAEDVHRTGVGDALRYRLADRLYAKASWEWATRMPSPDELFGDGVLVDEQLALRPETSHNLNLGTTLDELRTASGAFRADAHLFLRSADDLISRLFNDNRMRHENVGRARSLGAEVAAGWTSPDGLFGLDGNLTWVDFRNLSESGAYVRQHGQRIPNQPWLFANAALRLRVDRMMGLEDRVELVWNSRFVREYFRGWEGDGRLDSKQRVPDQMVHTTAATWDTDAGFAQLSFAAEVQNLLDAAAYDSVGTQRPGRAFFFKTTAAF